MLNEQTKFTLSLSRLVLIIFVVVGAAFTVGMTYQQIIPDKKLAEKQTKEITDIKVTLSRVTTLLEKMEDKQSNTTREINALQSKTSTINTELQIVSSYLREDSRKNKP